METRTAQLEVWAESAEGREMRRKGRREGMSMVKVVGGGEVKVVFSGVVVTCCEKARTLQSSITDLDMMYLVSSRQVCKRGKNPPHSTRETNPNCLLR